MEPLFCRILDVIQCYPQCGAARKSFRFTNVVTTHPKGNRKVGAKLPRQSIKHVNLIVMLQEVDFILWRPWMCIQHFMVLHRTFRSAAEFTGTGTEATGTGYTSFNKSNAGNALSKFIHISCCFLILRKLLNSIFSQYMYLFSAHINSIYSVVELFLSAGCHFP